MADPSLIERLLQIRGTQFTPIENALVTEAASTLEDQARLIGECRSVVAAMILLHDAGGITLATMRDARALLTKLNAFGERDE